MSRMNPHQVGQLAALASADRSTAIAGENIRTTLMDNIARAELKQKSDFQMQNAKLAQDQMKQTEALAKLDVETRKELEASSQEHASGMQQDRHMFEEEQNEEDREARKQADAKQALFETKLSEIETNAQITIANKRIEISNNLDKNMTELNTQHDDEMHEANARVLKAKKDLTYATIINKVLGPEGSAFVKISERLDKDYKTMMDTAARMDAQWEQGVTSTFNTGITTMSPMVKAWLGGKGETWRWLPSWAVEDRKDPRDQGFDDRTRQEPFLKGRGDSSLPESYRRVAAGQIADGIFDNVEMGMLGMEGGEADAYRGAIKGHFNDMLKLGMLKRTGADQAMFNAQIQVAADSLMKIRNINPDDEIFDRALAQIANKARKVLGGGEEAEETLQLLGSKSVGRTGGEADPDADSAMRMVMKDLIGVRANESLLAKVLKGKGNDGPLNQTNTDMSGKDKETMGGLMPQVYADMRNTMSVAQFEFKIGQYLDRDGPFFKRILEAFDKYKTRRGGLLSELDDDWHRDDLVADEDYFTGQVSSKKTSLEDAEKAEGDVGIGNRQKVQEIHSRAAAGSEIPYMDYGPATEIYEKDIYD